MTWVVNIGATCNTNTPLSLGCVGGGGKVRGLLVERMVKLIGVEPKGGYQLALRFSDGAAGVFDFAPFVDANVPMAAPLRAPVFFACHYIKLGALTWPNGLDSSVGALYRRLQDAEKLVHGKRVA